MCCGLNTECIIERKDAVHAWCIDIVWSSALLHSVQISASLKWVPENCTTITAQSGQLAVNEDRKLILHPNFVQHPPPPPPACGWHPIHTQQFRSLKKWRNELSFRVNWESAQKFNNTYYKCIKYIWFWIESIFKWYSKPTNFGMKRRQVAEGKVRCEQLGWKELFNDIPAFR